ncbi:histidinol-phosphatase [Alkalibaculum sporogenes]|nr:histidinol-phosphatase [Alkalibaculum sporogenes]
MKRFISNYHTHNNYCDGKNTIEEMVIAAIDKGILHLGISSHAAIINQEHWTMHESEMNNYLKEISIIKDRYSKKIVIYSGLEIDYFNGLGLNPLAIPYIEYLDYYIGSVHTLYAHNTGDFCFVDESREVLEQAIDRMFKGNVEYAVRHYYNSIKEMVVKYEPTIIGHIDIIKKNNKGNYFFNEEEKWYKDIIVETLNVINRSNSIIEINTGGIPRYGSDCLYPSTFILEEILKNNMDITVNADSHSVEGIDFYYDEIYTIVKDIGFKRIMTFTHDGWIPYKL